MPTFLIVELRESVRIDGESLAVIASVVCGPHVMDVDVTLALRPGAGRRYSVIIRSWTIEERGRDLVNGADSGLSRRDLCQKQLRPKLQRIVLRGEVRDVYRSCRCIQRNVAQKLLTGGARRDWLKGRPGIAAVG